MKNYFIYFTIISLLALTSCKKDQKVGGPCDYVTFERPMTVTFIDGDLNNEFMISFQEKGSTGDDVYRLNNEQIKKVFRNFDVATFKDKSNVYMVTTEEITDGSCVPFIITKIELK